MSEEIVQTVKMLDTDSDGIIDKTEAHHLFKDLVTRRSDLGLSEDNYDSWFAILDIDTDGKVTVDELIAYLTSINYTA